MNRAFFLGASALIAAAMGCGSSNNDDGTGAGSGTGGNCGLKEATNTEFCSASAPALDCSKVGKGFQTSVCGIDLPSVGDELKRSANVDEYHGDGPPQVQCFAPASYPAAPSATPETVTVEGIAQIFAHGCNSSGLSITFYKVNRDGSANDGKLGDVVGSTVITADDCKVDGVKSDYDMCSDGRYECRYSYPDVPTDTELAIKTEGGGKWSPLLQYNIYIPQSEVVDGKWTHDTRALASDDYTAIYAVAVGSPTPGKGAIAGEVHDCGDVRLQNAVVNVDTTTNGGMFYFSDNEDNPLPKPGATATSTLGLYAAFDVPAGQVTVAAAGKLGDDVVTLGEHHVYVYPDTVTTLTFKGLQPYQLPKK